MNDNERLEAIRQAFALIDSSKVIDETNARARRLVCDVATSRFLLTRLEEAEQQLKDVRLISETGEQALNMTLGKIQNAVRDRMIEVVEKKRDEWRSKANGFHDDAGMSLHDVAMRNYWMAQGADHIVSAFKAVNTVSEGAV